MDHMGSLKSGNQALHHGMDHRHMSFGAKGTLGL